MEYADYVDFLLQNEDLYQYCPEGVSLTPLCIGMINEKVVDCFFCYEECDEGQSLLWAIRFDCISGLKEKCNIFKTDNEKFSESTNHNMDDVYANLYPKVRSFAFAEELSTEQKENLREYHEAMKCVMGKELFDIYIEYFPEVFIWIQKSLLV